METIKNIKLTDFSLRHFDRKFGGSKILDIKPAEFEQTINDACDVGPDEHGSKLLYVLNGYADFCYLLVFNNFTEARVGVLPITLENYQYLRSGYSKRAENELPVLTRYFDLPLSAHRASNLIVVLYSREQLEKEHKATNPDQPFEFSGDWGVVSIMAQDQKRPHPVPPITMMRNTLGVEYGGSGVSLDKEAYLHSIKFWEGHAVVR